MKTFFTSDTHYWHKNIIKYSQRPFDSIEAMNEALIDNYNAIVKPQDTVIFLGDIFFCNLEKAQTILKRLSGRKKILVRGNHDQRSSRMLKIGFDWVCDSMELKIANQRVFLSHYPYRPSLWDIFKAKYIQRHYIDTRKLYKRLPRMNYWLLHGHIHEHWQIWNRQINVGVDVWDFNPVSLDTITAIMDKNL